MFHLTLLELLNLIVVLMTIVGSVLFILHNTIHHKRWRISQDSLHTCRFCSRRFLVNRFEENSICPNCHTLCQIKWKEQSSD